MRAWRVIPTALICYALLCATLAVFFGELAFRPLRMPLRETQFAKNITARFGADLMETRHSSFMESDTTAKE